MKKMRKKRGFISPHALIKTRKFITVKGFPEKFLDEDFLHGTSTLYGPFFS